MKRFFNLCLWVSFSFYGLAYADNSSEQVNPNSSNSKVAAQAATGAVNTVSSSNSMTGQTSVKVAEIQSTSPWSASYLHWITDIEAGSTYNYLKLNYKLSNGVTLSAVPVFTFDYKWSENNIANVAALDSYVQMALPSVAIEGTTGIDMAFRAYAPTSQGAQDKGTNGRLYGVASIGKELTKKLSTSVNTLNWFYSQSRDSYLNSKNEARANLEYVGFHVADLTYSFTDDLNVSAAVQLENQVFVFGPKTDVFYLDLSTTYAVSPLLSLNLGISNARSVAGFAELGGSPSTNTAYLIAQGKLY
jgi:hypothetical protein